MDCIVWVDLIDTPPSVKLIHKSELLSEGNDPGTITENSLRWIYVQRNVEDPTTKLASDMTPDVAKTHKEIEAPDFMPKIMPWKTTQDELREHFSDQMDQLRENPKLGEMFLDGLRLKYIRKFAEEIFDKDQSPELSRDLKDNPELREQGIDMLMEDFMGRYFGKASDV